MKGTKKRIRKYLSICLALILCVCMLPMSAFAKNIEGTQDDLQDTLLENEKKSYSDEETGSEFSDESLQKESLSEDTEPFIEEDESEEIISEKNSNDEENTSEENASEEKSSEDEKSSENNSLEEKTSDEITSEELILEEASSQKTRNKKNGAKSPETDTEEASSILDLVDYIEVDDITWFCWQKAVSIGYYSETCEWIDERWEFFDTDPDEIRIKFKDEEEPVTVSIYEAIDLLEEKQEGLPNYHVMEYHTEGNDQTPLHEWDANSQHPMTFQIGPFQANYNVNIVCPVESVVVSDVTHIEGDFALGIGYYDGENYDPSIEWEFYSYEPSELEVTLTNQYIDPETDEPYKIIGSFYEVEDRLVEILDLQDTFYPYGCNFYDDDPQTPTVRWDLGPHRAYIEVLGKKAEYSVIIETIPIISVHVDNVRYKEGYTIPYVEKIWNEETQSYVEDAWFGYPIEPKNITVETTDGVFSGSPDYVKYQLAQKYRTKSQYISIQIDSDQSRENPWEVGDHTVSLTIMGVKAEYVITVFENPIKSIKIDDVILFEGDLTRTHTRTHTEEGTYIEQSYDMYLPLIKHITVETTKGTFEATEASELKRKIAEAYDIDPNSGQIEAFYKNLPNQTPDNICTIGEYRCTFCFWETETDYTLKIIPNPIQSVNIEDVSVLENEMESINYYLDTETGETIKPEQPFEAYPSQPDKIEIQLIDHEPIVGDINYLRQQFIEIYGTYPGWQVLDGQSPENKWNIGPHPCILKIAGKQGNYNTIVTPSMGDYTGLKKLDDNQYGYISNGIWDTTFTGFVSGPVVETYNSVNPDESTYVENTDGFWYVKRGVVDLSETGPLFAQGTIPNEDGEQVEGIYKLSGGRWDAGFTGFVTSGDKKYYFEEGKTVSGWKTIGEKKYYLNDSGVVTTGWKTLDEKKYYFSTAGVMQTGLKKIENNKYYFNTKGVMQKDTLVKDDNGNKYIVNTKGIVQTYKVVPYDGKKYVADKNGILQLNKAFVVSGKTYVTDKNGVLLTNTLAKRDGKKYILDKNGVAYINKLVTYKGNKYIPDKNGVLQTNKVVTLSSKKYCVNAKGVVLTNGFAKVGGKTYYVNSSGVVQYGWKKISGKNYYFDKKTGVMATGTKKIDGKTYKFNSKGVCQNK